jgi:hypothetical protein
LKLVGKLDDSSGEEVPRERFRRFLRENVTDAAQLRDYISECLRSSGDIQYSRALQDLVNYIGSFLGFEVSFGRYQGTPGEVGFDGLWKSPTKFDVVIEVKTTETYAVKTKTLLDYVNGLISEKRINPENWIGLYVVGRPDPEVHQLENAILAEKRTHQSSCSGHECDTRVQSQDAQTNAVKSEVISEKFKEEWNACGVSLTRPLTPDTSDERPAMMKAQE